MKITFINMNCVGSNVVEIEKLEKNGDVKFKFADSDKIYIDGELFDLTSDIKWSNFINCFYDSPTEVFIHTICTVSATGAKVGRSVIRKLSYNS